MQLVLERKCAIKRIPPPTYDKVNIAECREEISQRWQRMLGHQLGALPSLDAHWSELPAFFAWLNGDNYEAQDTNLSSITISEDEAWVPLISEWHRGQDNLFEPIRYAAVNQLCVKLGYQNTFREIEPYSLRRTRAGFLQLYALKADTREIRGYRVDRIQSAEVTTRPFKPVFRIEFTDKGNLYAPRTRRSRLSSSVMYVIECSYCGKQFSRKKYSLKLNPHKQLGSDLQCPGRHGYLLDTN